MKQFRWLFVPIVALLGLTLLLASSSLIAQLSRIIVNIGGLIIATLTRTPQRGVWMVLLLIFLPIVMLEIFRYLADLVELKPPPPLSDPVVGRVELYSKFVIDSDNSGFAADQLNRQLRKVVSLSLTYQDDTKWGTLNKLIAASDAPPEVIDYFAERKGMVEPERVDEVIEWLGKGASR